MATDIIARGMAAKSNSNTNQLAEQVSAHTNNNDIHVTTADKSKWNDYDAKITTNESNITANTNAIAVLNGTGEGSVKKTVTDKVSEIVAGAPEDFDTLKEMSDWLMGHEESAVAMNTAIQSNTAAIAENETAIEANTSDIATNTSNVTTALSETALNRSTLGYQRKNLLKNTATDNTHRGVTFTMNADGSITMNGTAEGLSHTYLCHFNFKAGVKYRLSRGLNSETRISLIDSSGGEVSLSMDRGNGADFSFDEDTTMQVRLRAGNTGEVLSNVTVYPMLRYADILDDTYEPYVPSVEEKLAELEARLAALEGGE